MDSNSRRFPATRVSDLIVAYFLRGIRSLDGLPTQQALATRRILPAQPSRARRQQEH
ncbi:hypothetical protein BH24CHL6_BH24CHL6_13400 [soil metagenome]